MPWPLVALACFLSPIGLVCLLTSSTGCGDPPSACDKCPAGTECQRIPLRPGDPLNATRYRCVTVVKEVMQSLPVESDGGAEQ